MLVRIYREADFSKFSKYIELAFNCNYILGCKKYLDWQYGGSLYILEAGDKIIGHFGFKDIPYKIRDEVKPVRVLMNLFVLPPFRVLGGGVALMRAIFNTKGPILVSGYSPAFQKLCSRLNKNWRAQGNLSRFMTILKNYHPLLADYEVPAKLLFKSRQNDIFSIEVDTKDPKLLEQVWLRFRSHYRVTVERSSDYIRWRFLDHPFIKYSVLVCRRAGLACGYLIGKMETDQGFKIARIIDLIGPAEAASSLISEFVAISFRQDVDAVDFMFSGRLYYKPLFEAGFFDVAGTDFESFPILFNPISTKKTFINIASNNMDFRSGDCYLTKAEGDQDRPNTY